MRFSELLNRLGQVTGETPRHLASDPELQGANALDQAIPGQLSFLERGNALATALGNTRASAVLLPPDPDLQAIATAQGLAWVAFKDPRLAFAESLDCLHPRKPKHPGIHPTAVVDSSATIGSGVHIGPHVVVGEACTIAEGCTLHAGAVLYEDVQLAKGCEIHSGAVLHPGSRLAAQCVVHSNAVVGSEGFGFVPTAQGWRKMPQTGLVVLEEAVEVGCGTTIDRPSVGETRIGAGTKIDNLVQIGHGVILAGQVGVANRAVIGDGAIASSKSGIHGEVAAGEVVSGYPAIPNRLWLRCSAAFNKLPEMAKTLRRLQASEPKATRQ